MLPARHLAGRSSQQATQPFRTASADRSASHFKKLHFSHSRNEHVFWQVMTPPPVAALIQPAASEDQVPDHRYPNPSKASVHPGEAADPEGARLGYLSGPDHPDPIELRVSGRFPAWISGTLWRVGPGTYELPTKVGTDYEISHWFDGHGMLHAFQLDGASNRVLYRSRSTTQELNEHIYEGRRNPIRFHKPDDPCKGMFAKMFSTFRNIANATLPNAEGVSNQNVAVTISSTFTAIGTMALPSRNGGPGIPLVTGTDANVLAAFDPETLEPLRTLDYSKLHPDLRGPCSGAHGVTIDGTFYNFVLQFGRVPTYRVFGLRAHEEDHGASDTQDAETSRAGEGKRQAPECEILAAITDAPLAYLHSLAGTERYIILTIWESDFSYQGLGIILSASVVGGLKPWAGRPTLHLVIDRLGGRGVVARFRSPPMFAFHHINAYDRVRAVVDGKGASGEVVDVVLDFVYWENNDVIHAFEMERLWNSDFERFYRQRNGPVRVVLPDVARVTDPNAVHTARVFDGYPSTGTSDRSGDSSSKASADTDRELLNFELPVLNPHYAWKRARYAYGIHHTPHARRVLADTIAKIDLDRLEEEERPRGRAPLDESSLASLEYASPLVALWDDGGQRGLVPGEPIFIPTPAEHGGTGAEDDGVLLVVALDSHARTSRLYAVDARTMQTIASADVDRVVPYGFHGTYQAKA